MSFDISCSPWKLDDKESLVTNPFTQEVTSQRMGKPLSPSELKAVKALFKKVKAKESVDDGFYSIDFRDGGSAEVFTEDLATGCMVALRGITHDVLTFLVGLAQAGNWVMRVPMEEPLEIFPSDESSKANPPASLTRVVCDSPDQLEILLTKGFRAWKHYRDQVCE
jgi:hypothetical protein